MNSTMIKKFFLYILLPPFVRRLAPPNLLSFLKLLQQTFIHKIKFLNKNILFHLIIL